jgi:broad specificity phosphatase PhoE
MPWLVVVMSTARWFILCVIAADAARRIVRQPIMPLHLFFIRHGETAWSLDGRHTGRTEVPLTQRGEVDARALGTRLPAPSFVRVFSSPRLRARRTGELMGLASTMEIDPELEEWNYGEYEGRRTVEIHSTRPNWNIFRDGCPGGESPAEIGARTDRVIARLRAIDGRAAVIAHSHFGRVLGARWIGLEVAAGEHLVLATASLSVLEWDPARSPAAAIALWNAGASHLWDGHPGSPPAH